MIERQGLGHVTARIIADSVNEYSGDRLTTFELEYPRFIHSEFMTHRMLSKNAASSRAIPVATMHKQLVEVPQAPIQWGKNMPGMQAKEELKDLEKLAAQGLWNAARDSAIATAKVMNDVGVHKQIVNRITEPFMQMKVVCSGTEWANFFWLRNHPDAQPEIQELAKTMWDAYTSSVPKVLYHGDWHLPYIDTRRYDCDNLNYYDDLGLRMSLENAIKVSVSCCAQVSYRKLDDSLEKALNIYDRLINSVPVHASPTEHQATPIEPDFESCYPDAWSHGITHQDKYGKLWSGNFKGWIQNRQLIPNNYKGSF